MNRQRPNIHERILWLAEKAQAEMPGPIYRIYDAVGRPTSFIGTLSECNAHSGDRDVTYVQVGEN